MWEFKIRDQLTACLPNDTKEDLKARLRLYVPFHQIYLNGFCADVLSPHMWRQKIRGIVKRAISDNTLTVVLSPDVDGIVSTIILAEYARREHNASVEVIGTYDSESLRMVEGASVDDAKKAVWVDLDVRFDVPYVIGQHFLGNSSVGESYFNPNLEMGVTANMFSKCPISTTHLLLWGLFDEEGHACDALKGEEVTCARAAVAHADSLYIIAKKYNRNVWKWARMLFEEEIFPQTLKMLLGNTYNQNALEAHHKFLCSIVPHISCSGKPKKSWIEFRRHQSVKKNGHMGHVKAMIDIVAGHFGVEPPAMRNGQHVVWKGRRVMWDAASHDWASEEFEQQLAKAKVRSHAIVNRNTISVTVGKPLVEPVVEERPKKRVRFNLET